jgi:hypothetical protein
MTWPVGIYILIVLLYSGRKKLVLLFEETIVLALKNIYISLIS